LANYRIEISARPPKKRC